VSIADWYVVVLLFGAGGGIALFWIVALAARKVDAIGDFGATRNGHIAAELVTAALCLAGAVLRLGDEHAVATTASSAAGLGAVVYAALQSPGYYRAKAPHVVPILAVTALATIPAFVILAAGR
jgi:hypothetical protein